MTHPLLSFSTEVAKALAAGEPVVALESTIITHGMPYPANLETALGVETLVREAGAVPATVAVLEGEIRIGLEAEALSTLAQTRDVLKVSRADLAYAVASGKPGSTTVAATMMAAKLAGIEVFATGGIGGVHQGAETSFDISADLQELAQTDVITVCAGAKAILDLPKTLEVLETLGVPVIGYRTDELPAFWSRESGLPVPLRMDDTQQIADLWQTRKALGQHGGLLIANPVPEAAEIPRTQMASHIHAAFDAAVQNAVTAKDVTPFMLGEIYTSTKGRSLETNIALVRNNAALASEIAIALRQGTKLRPLT